MPEPVAGSDNPFAAPGAVARGPRLRPGPNRYAGFWWRAWAGVIDLLVLAPASLLAQANKWWWHRPAITWSMLLAYPAYKVLMDAGGGTIGKRAAGIVIIDATAAHPGFARAISRNWPVLVAHAADALIVLSADGIVTRAAGDPANLARAATILSPCLLIWLFMAVDALSIGFAHQKRALHDRWAGTWCIRPRAVER